MPDRPTIVRPETIALRERLSRARLHLLFTPAACPPGDPLAVLDAALPSIDVVQVRPKAIGSGARAPCAARETFDWTRRVLDLVRARPDLDVLVIVDDRVDVALALAPEGCAGVHLGRDDSPVDVARRELGDDLLIGLSTHTLQQAAEADDAPADYLGFGPVFATATKGYAAGLGAESAWIASQAVAKPMFPIGGITRENAGELTRIGRAAVASAILAAEDPARAARELRALLGA
jgi:thiamine-phosphate pyrophosphorylase